MEHCPGCPCRGLAIGTRGDPTSRIGLVGEAPGAKEIEQGRPFVGPAGAVLWKALDEAGLAEADLFITNAVACRPHPVHPWVKAMRACHKRLARDIAASPRDVIVALGVTAVQAVTGQRGFPVTKKQPGTELPSIWGRVVPTLHPAYVLRRGLDGLEYQTLVDDLKRVRRLAGV